MDNNNIQQNLDVLLAEMTTKLKQAGIPVSDKIAPAVIINRRAKKRLGCCIYREGLYTIEISSLLVDEKKYSGVLAGGSRPSLLEETMAHELLHTCPGCRNHGKLWKQYAAAVNCSYGYAIRRTVETGDNPEINEAKYILLCRQCGREIKRQRLSKAVKYPARYRCACGGRLKRVQ